MPLEKWIDFQAAFDKRSSEPQENYGIHGVEMKWYVRGAEGVVQWQVYTNWHWLNMPYKPVAVDLGYHSYVPRYEGQSSLTKFCALLNGKPCYYDGSGLNAEPVLDLLIREGSDAVWKQLEKYYRSVFLD